MTDTEYGDRIINAIIKSGFLEIENAPICEDDEIIQHAHIICWAANAPEQLHTLIQNIIMETRLICLSNLPQWKPDIQVEPEQQQ